MFDFILNGLKDRIKQTKAHETSFKQTQINETRLSPKPTLRSKRDRTTMYHRKGGHLQKQSNMASLEDKVGMKVNIINMLREAT
jgi:hypothetical protein